MRLLLHAIRSPRSCRLPPGRDAGGKGRNLSSALPGLSARRRGRAVAPSSGSSTVRRSPNAWTFGVYLHGELYSSVRISVLTPEWRMSCSAEAFGEILHPRLDRGEDHHRSGPVRRRSRKGQAVPGIALCHASPRLHGVRIFQCRYRDWRSFARNTRRFIAACSCTRPSPSRACSRPVKPVGLMAADFRPSREKGFRALSR